MVNSNGGLSSTFGYRTLAVWVIALGLFMVVSPNWFYGPSWSYFSDHGHWLLPAGGKGMGTCLIFIGGVQLLVVWRDKQRWIAPLFFLSGFVFWVSGFLLAGEGLAGHQGLMEAPLMIALGIHKFVVMAHASIEYRHQRSDE